MKILLRTIKKVIFYNPMPGENLLKKKKVFNVSIVLHAGVALATGIILLIAMYPFFHGVLNIPSERVFAAKIIYLCTLLSTLLTIVNVPYDAIMNAHENMLYYSLVGIFESLLKLLVAFACVYTSSDKLILYGILMALIPFITLSIMKIYCHRKYEECVFGLHRYWDVSLVKQITSFFSWNFLTAISSLASFYGTSLVLNHFFGTVLNAAQGIANQVNGQLSNFSLNLMKAVNPIIVNQVLNIATSVVQNNLKLLEEGNLDTIGIYDMDLPEDRINDLKKGIIAKIPIGVITKNSLLANIGPEIPIRLHYVGDVNSNITTEITPYGINNALVKIGVKLEMTAQIILPFLTDKMVLNCDIPLAIKMIQGTVPNYYGSGLVKDSSLYSIPLDK